MFKLKPILFLLVSLCFLLSCNKSKEIKEKHYENQIGNTPFNPSLDNSYFKFCDSTNVLHKRALVKYIGGERALKREILKQYNFNSNYASFTGYFVIRFAINCNNETGRFRMDVLNSNFQPTKCPEALEEHILNIAKALKNWKHVVYKNEYRDCYRFISIKMKNGKIETT